MRLINTETLRLEEFNEANRPPYAILSHTWGDQEVTFQDMQADPSQHAWKAGYQKIVQTCKEASREDIKYAWVDTCCIDKTSSAELSEAINSMFRWYEDAKICYAYLSDVHAKSHGGNRIAESRWFSRGWTLQELIAPRQLVFYKSSWQTMGSRSAHSNSISRATGIEERFLKNSDNIGPMLRSASIAQRMSWASRRQTTRTEDLAYCLLGIFGINMPLLYGEGAKAFTRLQEEIIRHTDDQSIFAWGLPWSKGLGFKPDTSTSVLARSPIAFAASQDIVPVDTGEESAPFSLTNRGIRVDLCVKWLKGRPYGMIPCRQHKATDLFVMELEELPGRRFCRPPNAAVGWMDHLTWKQTPKIPIYLVTVPPPERYRIPPGSFLVKPFASNISVKVASKDYTWAPATGLITMDKPEDRFGKEMELLLVCETNPSAYNPQRLCTLRVWVRRPPKYAKEFEWVTYDMRDYSPEHHVRGRNKPTEPFTIKVEKQVLFGQRVVVIEILHPEKGGGMWTWLRWARMRLARLLTICLFGLFPMGGSWLILVLPQLIQDLVLLQPALVVAATVITCPVQNFGFEEVLAEHIKDMTLSIVEVKSTIYSAWYLLAFWLNFPMMEHVSPVVEVFVWVFLWHTLSVLVPRLVLWAFLVLMLGIGHNRPQRRSRGARGH